MFKGIEMINLKDKFEKLEAKVILYKRKARELDDELRTEEETQKSIADNFPAIPSEDSDCRSMVEEAISEAMDKLKEFYEHCDTELNRKC